MSQRRNRGVRNSVLNNNGSRARSIAKGDDLAVVGMLNMLVGADSKLMFPGNAVQYFSLTVKDFSEGLVTIQKLTM